MKPTLALVALTLAASPTLAAASDGDRNPLAGPKLGLEVIRDSNQTRQAITLPNGNRNGMGVRAFAGYDAALGKAIIVGSEIGIGKGGRTTDQPSLVGGRYRVDPGLTFDVTWRAGIVPTTGLIIYGRGGYRWLQVKRSIVGQTTGNGDTRLTEKGFTYGGGIEYAVTPNVALRTEFNRTDYDRNFKQNRVSVGASFRF